MFVARLFLGLGIGAKSATVPIYSAECAPSAIRGALTMQWQMWTAFGIMLGFASSLIFYNVKDIAGIVGLNWRLMMGSACLCAIFVCGTILFCPESPRYLIEKSERLALKDDIEGALKCRQKAWENILKLRKSKIQAARDFYIMYKSSQVQAEAAVHRGSAVQELWGNLRNRRAMYASQICMFMQQVRFPRLSLQSIDDQLTHTFLVLWC
jgi:MFS family permease